MKITKASGVLFGAVYTSMSRSWPGKQGPDQWDWGQSYSVLTDRFNSAWGVYGQGRSWTRGLDVSIALSNRAGIVTP